MHKVLVVTIAALAVVIGATSTKFGGGASAKSTFARVEAKNKFFRTSDGVRLHYLEMGKGPTIVFVPGWTVPAWMWDLQIRFFAKEYHVVALDPRSQGGSERSNEGNNPETRARDIKELLETLKAGPVVLVGHSLAVTELVSYADQFGTASVAGLVLVDFPISQFPKPEETDQILGFVHQVSVNRKEAVSALASTFFKQPPPPGYVEGVLEDSNKVPTNTAVALLASILGTDCRPALSKIDVPVLYIIRPIHLKDGDWLQHNVPTAQVETFDDGHCMFVDVPDRFNSVVNRFARGAFERRRSPGDPR